MSWLDRLGDALLRLGRDASEAVGLRSSRSSPPPAEPAEPARSPRRRGARGREAELQRRLAAAEAALVTERARAQRELERERRLRQSLQREHRVERRLRKEPSARPTDAPQIVLPGVSGSAEAALFGTPRKSNFHTRAQAHAWARNAGIPPHYYAIIRTGDHYEIYVVDSGGVRV